MNSSLAAKLRFFAVYLLSVGFIAVIIGLLMGMGDANKTPQAAASVVTDEELWAANKYLHNRVAEMDALYAASLQDTARRYSNGGELQEAESAFAVSLDSVQGAIGGKDDDLQPAWEQMLTGFRVGAASRKALLQAYNSQPQPVASSAAPVNNQQPLNLQQQLQQRDATITDLNRQLAARPTVVASNNQQGNAELSRSVAALRAALEKEKAENASLNRSYKAVVDDHKRVLAQLQSARKG